ncbi:MAG: hypothetical protein LBS98_07645 [Coriobacteriales bacterium]|jgi:hypothetical protein|nr:hypothetical protein [Coriobacteriales bacterium]
MQAQIEIKARQGEKDLYEGSKVDGAVFSRKAGLSKKTWKRVKKINPAFGTESELCYVAGIR